jgi:uncharacterized protein involved in exopolysaccharide biosynthesis
MTENTPKPSEDEIDLKDLIIPIWIARKQIFTIATLFGILGGIVGFLTPPTYTATSTFLPQSTQSSGVAGSLGGIAALAGISMNTPMAGGDIPPSLYATVLASEPFRKRIIDTKIKVNGDSITYRSYLENKKGSALGTIQEYTIGLPGKVIGLFTPSIEEKQSGIGSQVSESLSNKEYGLLKSILGKINISNNLKDGLISISVVESDPIVAAQVTIVTEKVLQEWISDYKRKNAKAQYDFIEKLFLEKEKKFFLIQEELANYMDRNQNILSATYLTRLQRLQAEFDLVNTVYSDLAKQKEQAAIQLSKDTPTFSVLDPVKVPKEKTGPRRSMYVFVPFFLGLIFLSGWTLIKKPIKSFLKSIYTIK